VSLPAPVLGLSPANDALVDRFGRVHRYLRVSITDRCSLKCTYCVPQGGLPQLPRKELLSYQEITRVVAAMRDLGVRRVRLTGGEPLIRRDVVVLVDALGALGLEELSMTTNALRLTDLAVPLRRAGLRRVNVSCDAVEPDLFRAMTGGGDLSRVLAGIEAARLAGLLPIKINMVVIAGENDHHVVPLLEHFARWPEEIVVRFLEHMPFGTSRRDHVSSAALRERIGARYTLDPLGGRSDGGPAVAWRVRETGQEIGFISPITEHFCERCNRLRLDADGHLRTCLSRDDAPSLRDVLRGGADDAELGAIVRAMVWGKVAGHEATEDGGRAFEGVMTWIGG
jgi:cyclic pyranopterin phosphate synthase